MKTTLSKILVLTLVSFALPMLAPAVNLTWDANTAVTGAQDGSGTWDTNTANWWNGSADVLFNNATPDAAFFGAAGGAAGTVTLGTNITPFGITFNAASVGNYTLAGGGFTIGLTNRTVTANVSATISAPIGGTAVTLGNSAANAPNGTLTLSGNNIYTGGFTFGPNLANTTGSVRANSSTAFGTGTINYNSQGNQTSHRMELVGGVNIANAITLQGRNNSSMAFESISGANILSGLITGGAGGADYGFQVDGSSSLTLASNYVMQASGPRRLAFRGTGTGAVNGIISGGVAANMVDKAGSGTWTFSGANTYTCPTIVGGGTLALDYTTQNNSKISDGMALILAGGTLNLNAGSHTEVVGSNIVAHGSSTISRSSGTSTLRLNVINRFPGGTVNFAAASLADADTLNSNGILGGYATVAGADWAINSTGLGDGAVTAYTGYTDIAATGSTIADGAASNVRLNSAGGGGNITLGAATTTVNTLLQNTTTAGTVDTAAGILRLGVTGGVLVPATAQSLTLGTAANSGTLTAGGADNTAGEIILINNSGNALTVNSIIADNGSGVVALTKSGTGSATLAGNNTHTGTNYLSGGTLNISSAANLGTGTLVINGGTLNNTADVDLTGRLTLLGTVGGYAGGTISVGSGLFLTNSSVIANSTIALGYANYGSLTKTGSGTLILGGANTYNHNTLINGGTIVISADNNLGAAPGCYVPDQLVLNSGTLQSAGTFTLSANRGIRLGPINGSGSGTINVDASQTLTFNGQLSDNWAGSGSLTKTGDGTLILGGGVNDYSGNTTVSAGILQINNSRTIPNGAGKGNLVNNGTVNINGVNVQLNGLTGSGTVDNLTAAAMTLTVGNNDQGGTFSGVIQNGGGGALALAKTGGGTLTLSGASGYTGSTLINSGVLALSGSGSIGSTTNIVVGASGTLNVTALSGGTLTLNAGQTLSGTGTVLGTIDTSGGGAVAPGTSAGTLTIAGLVLNNGILNYELANVTTTGGGVNDHIVVTGQLNISGPTTVNLTYLNGLPAGSGKYTLISYGSFTGDVNNITPVPGFTLNNNTVAKTIELIINHVPVSLTWVGDGIGNVWDVNTTPNWSGGAVFFNGDTANFDNTGSATPAINISVPVIAAAVNVSGSQNYNFTGSSLSSAGLTKSGNGTLTLENDNSFTAGTLIGGGTVQIGNAGTTGTLGGGEITNNAALVFNRDSFSVTNAISGSGSVAQIGTGATALTASNSYAGLTTITAGAILAANGSALGSTVAGTVVSSLAQLYITANVNLGEEALTLTGEGPLADGALRKGGGGASTLGGAVTLLGDTTIKLDGNTTLNLTNAAGISGAAANANLTLAGDGGSAGSIAGPIALGSGTITNNGGTWTVSSSNNYAGNTIINGGTLRISSPLSLGVPPVAWTPDRVLFNGGALGVSSNVVFDDGKIGFTLANNGSLLVDAGATLTMSNEITGAFNLTKGFPGTLILKGSNSFAGVLFLDRGVDGNNNDGITRITTTNAIANVTEIRSRNSSVNSAGGATLQLDGTAGDLNILQPLWFSCRQDPATNATIQSLAGSNTLSGAFTITSGGNWLHVQTDAGAKLALSGAIQYNDTLLALRNLHFRGEGDTLVAADILLSANATTPVNVVKSGTGLLTLAGANTHSGNTIISNGVLSLIGSITSTGNVTVVGGTLAGTGTITVDADVSVLAGGTLAPGNAGIGTLTINNDLTLAGNTSVEVNKSNGQRDQIVGLGTVLYGGTLTVANLAGTPVLGDTFTLFSATAAGGNFASIAGIPAPGLAWSFNPASGVLSVINGPALNPTNITSTVSGNLLTLSWPADHLGWKLQVQTNSINVGLRSNWVDVAGSTGVTTMNFTLDPANGSVFYRMVYP